MPRVRRVSSLPIVVCLLVLPASCLPVTVATSLDEDEANRVLMTLVQSGIDAEKEADPAGEGHFRVHVPRSEVGPALQTLQAEQLPRRSQPHGDESLGRDALVPSPLAEHAQLMASIRSELERTLESVGGVLRARVHIDAPTSPVSLGETPKRATASVLLEHRGGAPPLSSNDVQRLIAGALVDLAPSDVTVIFLPRPPVDHAIRETSLTQVGPILVSTHSARRLQWLLGLLCGLTAVFASSTMALYRKLGLQRAGASTRET